MVYIFPLSTVIYSASSRSGVWFRSLLVNSSSVSALSLSKVSTALVPVTELTAVEVVVPVFLSVELPALLLSDVSALHAASINAIIMAIMDVKYLFFIVVTSCCYI